MIGGPAQGKSVHQRWQRKPTSRPSLGCATAAPGPERHAEGSVAEGLCAPDESRTGTFSNHAIETRSRLNAAGPRKEGGVTYLRRHEDRRSKSAPRHPAETIYNYHGPRNNEMGTIQPLEEIGRLPAGNRLLPAPPMAVQSEGKIPAI